MDNTIIRTNQAFTCYRFLLLGKIFLKGDDKEQESLEIMLNFSAMISAFKKSQGGLTDYKTPSADTPSIQKQAKKKMFSPALKTKAI